MNVYTFGRLVCCGDTFRGTAAAEDLDELRAELLGGAGVNGWLIPKATMRPICAGKCQWWSSSNFTALF
nr:hypothetical protein Iba_chr01aCG3680 [Ipomoea batatas]